MSLFVLVEDLNRHGWIKCTFFGGIVLVEVLVDRVFVSRVFVSRVFVSRVFIEWVFVSRIFFDWVFVEEILVDGFNGCQGRLRNGDRLHHEMDRFQSGCFRFHVLDFVVENWSLIKMIEFFKMIWEKLGRS